jgi:hypothetical protein
MTTRSRNSGVLMLCGRKPEPVAWEMHEVICRLGDLYYYRLSGDTNPVTIPVGRFADVLDGVRAAVAQAEHIFLDDAGKLVGDPHWGDDGRRSLIRRVLDQCHNSHGHEAGCPHRLAGPGHLRDLDRASHVGDIDPTTGLRSSDLEDAGADIHQDSPVALRLGADHAEIYARTGRTGHSPSERT